MNTHIWRKMCPRLDNLAKLQFHLAVDGETGMLRTICQHYEFIKDEYATAGAAGAGKLGTLKDLIKLGFPSKHAFIAAVSGDQMEVVDCLLDDRTFDLALPLEMAAVSGNLRMLKRLVAAGGILTSTLFNYYRVLEDADIFEFLLQHNVSLTKENMAYAAGSGRTDNVAFLLNHKCPHDDYAYSYAIRGGNLKMVMFLHSQGVTITPRCVALAHEDGSPDILDFFQRSGAELIEDANNAMRRALRPCTKCTHERDWTNTPSNFKGPKFTKVSA